MTSSPGPLSSIGAVELDMSAVPANPFNAGSVRRALASWLEVTAFGPDAIIDIALAVYEAMANSVEHAYRNASPTAAMTVRASYSAAGGMLEIVR